MKRNLLKIEQEIICGKKREGKGEEKFAVGISEEGNKKKFGREIWGELDEAL